MLPKNKDKIILLISLAVIVLNLFLLQKRKNSYNFDIETEIAKGIIYLDNDEIIEKKVNRESFPLEYNFSIRNFDDNNNINEVDFDYKIKIETSVNNFPIKYRLIDCEKNIELFLISGESPVLNLEKFEKKIRKFKLYVEWSDVEEEYSDDLEIKLKIQAVQKEEKIESENI